MSVAKLSWYALAVGVALSAASVEAQSFPSNVEVRIGGEEKQPADTLFINKEQCETEGESGEIRITVANLSNRQGLELLEFWVNSGTGKSCHTAEGRTWTGTGATQTTECTQIGGADEQIDTTREVLTFQARDLFTRDETCDLTSSQTLYIVPLASRTQNPGNVPAPIGDAIAIRFDVDVVALPPPDSVRGGSGESEISVRWDAVNSNDKFMKYQVYFDPTAIQESGGECTSELLVPGEELSADAREQLEQRETEGTSVSISPGSLGLEIGEAIPATVVTLDGARNRSVASEVVCVQRVSTTGFWDACQSEGDCRKGFDSCSVSFGAKESWLGASLGLLGLALWLRRRRTV